MALVIRCYQAVNVPNNQVNRSQQMANAILQLK